MFQYSMTKFEHIFQKQMLKATYILFNNIILLTLKIGYLLTIYIKHEIGPKEFQVKYFF
jgi:hypothetical protein